MSDDLVKQLGEIADYAETDTSKAIWDYLEAFREAAARIEALELRVEEVKAERDALREALRRLLSSPAISDGDQADPEWGCSETYAAEINARAALKRKKSDE